MWNSLQERAFDLSAVLPVSSLPGTILSGIFGYYDAPTLGEVIVWVAFLTITLFFFLRPEAAAVSPDPRAAKVS